MAVCGYYIERYVIVDSRKFWLSIFVFVLLILSEVAGTYQLYQKDPSKYLLLDNRNFITITGSTICFYVIVKYLFSRLQREKVKKGICYAGSLTFGIYLLSDVVIDVTRPVYQELCAHMHVLIAMGLWELLIFVICAVITSGLKEIPGLKKWI